MAGGYLKTQWDLLSQIIVRLENAWMRDPKKNPPCQLWDVHPFRERADYIANTGSVHNLKALINGNKQSRH